MDRELYILKNMATLNLTYWKVKTSREDIETKHPSRIDLINSMKATEKDLLEISECMKYFDREIEIVKKQNFNLTKLYHELLSEVTELRRIKNEQINNF